MVAYRIIGLAAAVVFGLTDSVFAAPMARASDMSGLVTRGNAASATSEGPSTYSPQRRSLEARAGKGKGKGKPKKKFNLNKAMGKATELVSSFGDLKHAASAAFGSGSSAGGEYVKRGLDTRDKGNGKGKGKGKKAAPKKGSGKKLSFTKIADNSVKLADGASNLLNAVSGATGAGGEYAKRGLDTRAKGNGKGKKAAPKKGSGKKLSFTKIADNSVKLADGASNLLNAVSGATGAGGEYAKRGLDTRAKGNGKGKGKGKKAAPKKGSGKKLSFTKIADNSVKLADGASNLLNAVSGATGAGGEYAKRGLDEYLEYYY